MLRGDNQRTSRSPMKMQRAMIKRKCSISDTPKRGASASRRPLSSVAVRTGLAAGVIRCTDRRLSAWAIERAAGLVTKLLCSPCPYIAVLVSAGVTRLAAELLACPALRHGRQCDG